MKLLYVGDVMGEVGLRLVECVVPELRIKEHIDMVIAQAENTSNGRGVTAADYRRLLAAGIDFCTGGNWSLYNEEIYPMLSDPHEPIIRPANYPENTPGLGFKTLNSSHGPILIISLLGHIVGRDADKPMDNALQVIDSILHDHPIEKYTAIIVNFHGDYSSEKRIIGYYLDGRVTAVVGDHWHIPTADADILPLGTAHITDVGMCGSLDSSIGIKLNSVIPRWRDNKQTHNILETIGRTQFNAVLLNLETDSKKVTDFKLIHTVYK